MAGATALQGVRDPLTCRGLRTALVEREDFGSGTSSKSTKLVHGGVRYLEKAVFNLDYGQLKLVFEALHERKRMLENAPHLCTALPIMTVQPLCDMRNIFIPAVFCACWGMRHWEVSCRLIMPICLRP